MYTSDIFKSGNIVRLTLRDYNVGDSTTTAVTLLAIDNYGLTIRWPKTNDGEGGGTTFYPYHRISSVQMIHEGTSN